MKKLVLTASILSIVTFSCSKDSSPSISQVPQVNPSLQEKVRMVKAMTPELHAQAHSVLSPLSRKLPEIQLIIGKASEVAEKVKHALDDDGRFVLSEIQKSCEVQKGEDRELYKSGQGAGANSVQVREHSVHGAHCPVTLSEKTTTKTLVKSVNANTGHTSFEREQEIVEAALIKAGKLKKAIGVIEVKQVTKLKINYVDVDPKHDHKIVTGHALVVGSSQGALKLVDGTSVPVEIEISGVVTAALSDYATVITMLFPKGELQISAFVKGEKVESYVNGQPATLEEIHTDFGIDLESELATLKH